MSGNGSGVAELVNKTAMEAALAGGSQEIRAVAQAVMQDAERLPVIQTDADFGMGSEYLAKLRFAEKRVEDFRVQTKRPFLDAGRAIDNACNVLLTPIRNRIGALVGALGTWQMEQERKAREAQAKQQKAVERAIAKDRPLPAVVPVEGPAKTVATEAGAVTFRSVWRFRVVDVAKVPRTFLSVNEVAVNAQIKAGIRDIPGLEIYEEKTASVR